MSPSKLLKTAFGIRALSKNEIKKIASQTEALVKSDPNLGSSSGVASMVRSASLEYLPTSESQDNIQTTSNTMDIKEVNILLLLLLIVLIHILSQNLCIVWFPYHKMLWWLVYGISLTFLLRVIF